MNYSELLNAFYIKCMENSNITLGNGKSFSGANKKTLDWAIENGLKDLGNINFHKFKDGLEFHWLMKSKDQTVKKFGGHINILPLKSILSDWKKIVYFDSDAQDSPKRIFKIVDFFVDEACVGFFIDKNEKHLLFYHEFESEFYPLFLDFDGYFQMMLKSYGFWYWQKVLSEINQKNAGPTTKHFIACMTELFPDFSFETYKKQYEQLKIK